MKLQQVCTYVCVQFQGPMAYKVSAQVRARTHLAYSYLSCCLTIHSSHVIHFCIDKQIISGCMHVHAIGENS